MRMSQVAGSIGIGHRLLHRYATKQVAIRIRLSFFMIVFLIMVQVLEYRCLLAGLPAGAYLWTIYRAFLSHAMVSYWYGNWPCRTGLVYPNMSFGRYWSASARWPAWMVSLPGQLASGALLLHVDCSAANHSKYRLGQRHHSSGPDRQRQHWQNGVLLWFRRS